MDVCRSSTAFRLLTIIHERAVSVAVRNLNANRLIAAADRSNPQNFLTAWQKIADIATYLYNNGAATLVTAVPIRDYLFNAPGR